MFEAKITTPDDGRTRRYIGMTDNSFKERYRNHKKSFDHHIYARETELSKFAWELKESGQKYNLKWLILKQAAAYTPGYLM